MVALILALRCYRAFLVPQAPPHEARPDDAEPDQHEDAGHHDSDQFNDFLLRFLLLLGYIF